MTFCFFHERWKASQLCKSFFYYAFPTRTTRWPAVSPTTGSYETFHISHYMALWQPAADTLSCGWATGVTQSVTEFHTTQSSAPPHFQTETASFIGRFRHGAGQVSDVRATHVQPSHLSVCVWDTSSSYTQWPEALE